MCTRRPARPVRTSGTPGSESRPSPRRGAASWREVGEFAAQLALQNLAVRVSRQVVPKDDFANALLLADTLVGPVDELGCGSLRTGAPDDDRDRGFSPSRTAYSDHGDILDGRVGAHDEFDVGRKDILATR